MTASDWQPACGVDIWRQRALLLRSIREFMFQRQVLEVDVPCLGQYSVTDPHIQPLQVNEPAWFLQTSPEYAMKRMLAVANEAIFYLGKSFRQGEVGTRHNPEFTMLEWYRPGFDHWQLMHEVADLLRDLLQAGDAALVSYRQAFLLATGLCPFSATLEELKICARQHVGACFDECDRDVWLDLLVSEVVQPQLSGLYQSRIVFLYHYPASQAALAKVVVDDDGHKVAERFEVFVDGLELANGYHELTDANEQARRFQQDQQRSQRLDLAVKAADLRLLAALQHGIADCAGVALGVDRLLMLMTGATCLADVLTFPADRC